MWGIEIVKNKETLSPFPRKEKMAEHLWEALFQKRVIAYKSTGLAGIDGDALMIAPPFIIEENEMDFVVGVVEEVLKDIVA